MIRVDVPEHNTFVDFPDGTDPGVIESTLKSSFPAKADDIGVLGRLAETPGTIRAMAETGAGLITGALAFPISKARGLYELARTGGDAGAAKAAEERWANAIQFEPTKSEARNAVARVGRLIEPVFGAAREASDLPMESWKVGPSGRYLGNVAAELGAAVAMGGAGKVAGKAKGAIKERINAAFKPIEGVLSESRAVPVKPKSAEFVKGRQAENDYRATLQGFENNKPPEPYEPKGSFYDYVDDLRRKEELFNQPVDLPTGSLDRGTILDLPNPEVIVPFDAMKYEILSKSDPVTYSATDKIFMDSMNNARDASMKDFMGKRVDAEPAPAMTEPPVSGKLEALKVETPAPEIVQPEPIVKAGQGKVDTVTPVIAETTKATGTKPASVAKSIEAKAIEQGLVKDGFDTLAGFDPTTMKVQAERAAKLMNENLEDARRMVRGEEPLPEGLRGASLVKAMEEHIKKTKDADAAYELANSPLVAEVSLSAQELSLTRGRELDSFSAKIAEIKKARSEGAGKDISKGQELKKTLKEETAKVNLPESDLKWNKFLDEIMCK